MKFITINQFKISLEKLQNYFFLIRNIIYTLTKENILKLLIIKKLENNKRF
jgi:hypothetical protein